MNASLTQHIRRFLVLIALLAYTAQSFAYVGGAIVMAAGESNSNNMSMSEQTMPGCHEAVQTDSVIDSGDHDCCKDGCSMMNCHSVSVLMSSVYALHILSLNVQNNRFEDVSFVNISSSLYRPPILR